MGGLRKYMPSNYWTFIVGSLALAGLFPLAGLWSMDEILASLQYDSGHGGGAVASIVLIVAIAGAFITALYMARAVYLTFFGEYKGAADPHESPKIMTYPLIGLAVLAAVAGFSNMPGIFTGFTSWVGARIIPMGDHHGEAINFLLAGAGLAAAAGGIAVGTRLWRRDRDTQAERDTFRIPFLYPLLERKYYIDDFYLRGIVNPTKGPIARAVDWSNAYVFDGVVNGVGAGAGFMAKIVYGGIDQRGIDLAVNAAAAATGEAGEQLRYATTGRVQQYAWALFAGTLLLVVGLLIFI